MTESDVPLKPPPKRKAQANPLLRAAAILATVVVIIPMLVPFGLVGVLGERFGAYMQPRYTNTDERLNRADAMRRFALPKDPSIAPLQAGLAFNALQPADTRKSAFSLVELPSRADAFWRDEELEPGLFPKARPTQVRGLPNPNLILGLVPAGFSKEEREFLERVATAPIWRTLDSVTRAPAVDMLGGRFRLPYPDSAHVFEMPLSKFAATKELAYASQVRAAYHLSRQQRDSAENVLRSIVSLGFVLIDNGTTLIDESLGAILVGIGRTALTDYYALTKNPEATALKALNETKSNEVARAAGPATRSAAEARAAMIAIVRDSTARRGIRFEMLTMLSFTPCTNLRELAFGSRGDVTEAIQLARKQLPRYPSEVALIDLSTRALTREFPPMGRPDAVIPQFLLGAASFASGILQNPRLKGCATLMAFGQPLG
ncbi:MAG: hypothetical protein V4550_18950 [Gemmatimonadota bacterium]